MSNASDGPSSAGFSLIRRIFDPMMMTLATLCVRPSVTLEAPVGDSLPDWNRSVSNYGKLAARSGATVQWPLHFGQSLLACALLEKLCARCSMQVFRT